MKYLRWIIGLLLISGTAYALTNLIVVVTLSDNQYTNLVAVASNRGQTPEQFLRTTNMGIAAELDIENENIRFQRLLQLWSNATIEKKLAAIQALQ
jgi:hypothetical protein